MMRRAGLTLMELLVVISILATLAAFLFPVYLRFRSRIYTTSCANQLRQIGLALKIYAQDYGRDDPYVVSYLGKLYPRYVTTKELLVCPYFSHLAPDVVSELHEWKQTRYAQPWSSYDTVKPVGLDDLARKYPDEIISFAEVYAVLGDRVPIAWCPVHRIGCPSFLGPSLKGRQFCAQYCTNPYAILPPELKGVQPIPPGILSDLSQPWIVLRWDGSVYIKGGGGWQFHFEEEFLERVVKGQSTKN